MTTEFPILSDLQKDALKEVGNIGAGHAATALSQLLNMTVSLSEPSFDLVPYDSVSGRFSPDQQVAALRMHVRGAVPGQMIVFFDRQQSEEFATRFLKRMIGDITIFSSMLDSTLMEFANIIGGAYLTALITLTGVDMIPSVPSLYYGTVESTLKSLSGLSPSAPVILIQSRFGEGDTEVFGRVILIPEESFIGKLLEPFGV